MITSSLAVLYKGTQNSGVLSLSITYALQVRKRTDGIFWQREHTKIYECHDYIFTYFFVSVDKITDLGNSIGIRHRVKCCIDRTYQRLRNNFRGKIVEQIFGTLNQKSLFSRLRSSHIRRRKQKQENKGKEKKSGSRIFISSSINFNIQNNLERTKFLLLSARFEPTTSSVRGSCRIPRNRTGEQKFECIPVYSGYWWNFAGLTPVTTRKHF